MNFILTKILRGSPQHNHNNNNNVTSDIVETSEENLIINNVVDPQHNNEKILNKSSKDNLVADLLTDDRNMMVIWKEFVYSNLISLLKMVKTQWCSFKLFYFYLKLGLLLLFMYICCNIYYD